MSKGLLKSRVSYRFFLGIFVCFLFINNSYGSMQLSSVSVPTLTPPSCSDASQYKELAPTPQQKALAPFMKSTCDSCASAIQSQRGQVAGAMTKAHSEDAAAAASASANSAGAAAATGSNQLSTFFNEGMNQAGGSAGLNGQASAASALASSLDSCAAAIDSACSGGMAAPDSNAAKAASGSCRASAAQARAVSADKLAEAGAMSGNSMADGALGQGLSALAGAAAQGMQKQDSTKNNSDKDVASQISKTNSNKLAESKNSNSASVTMANLEPEAKEAQRNTSAASREYTYNPKSGDAGKFVAAKNGLAKSTEGASTPAGSAAVSGSDASVAATAQEDQKAVSKEGEEASYASGSSSRSKPLLGLTVEGNEWMGAIDIGNNSATHGREPSSLGEPVAGAEDKLTLFQRVNHKINAVALKQNFKAAAPSAD